MNKDWLLIVTGISVGCAATMICTAILKKIANLCTWCQTKPTLQANQQLDRQENLPSAPMLS